MSRKVLLFVIDGLGVGSMPDACCSEFQNREMNTLRSILNMDKSICWSDGASSLMNYIEAVTQSKGLSLKYGKLKLGYEGADSYLGHCAMIGCVKSNKKVFLDDYASCITQHFKNHYNVINETGYICIDGHIYISNNMECDEGCAVNVISDISTFNRGISRSIADELKAIIPAMRFLIIAGTPFDAIKINNSIIGRQRLNGAMYYGIAVPKLNIYNQNYLVNHIGNINIGNNNLLTELDKANIPITLIGKTANIFNTIGDLYIEKNNLHEVLNATLRIWDSCAENFIFTNVQEVDLAGHENNVVKSRNAFFEIVSFMLTFIDKVSNEDMIIITADHGNDPLSDVNQHSREYVPIIIITKTAKPGIISKNYSLVDIAETICNYFGISKLGVGETIE